eukprot:12643884-Heterocapsa_arctica.AAC.1
MSKALYAGIIADDIETTAGYDRKRPRCDNELNTNPLFAECCRVRCMQWWGTTKPTDEHVVADNILSNQRRIGSWKAARQMLTQADAEASAVHATTSSKASGTRPTTPSVSRPASPSG